MATIQIQVDARNNAERTLGTLRRQINNLNTQLATNRQAVLNADAAERKNIETKNREIRATQGLLRAKQEAARIRISEARAAEQAQARIDRAERERQRAAQQTFNAIRQFNRRFLSNADRVAREYVREWERAERERAAASRRAAQEIERLVRSSQQQFRNLLRPVRAIGRELLTVFTFGGVFALERFGRAVFDSALRLDNLHRSLTSLTGSAEEAADQIQRLRELARLPGITFSGAARQFQGLNAIGVGTQQSLDIIRQFGNAAALSAGDTQSLARALTGLRQTIQRGALDQENLNQITENLGIAARALREEFGSALAEDIRAVEPDIDRFVERFVSALERLPRASEDSAQNVFSNFRNAIDELSGTLGREFLPIITRATQALTVFINDAAPDIVASAERMAAAIDNANITFADLRRLVNLLISGAGLFGVATILSRVSAIFITAARSARSLRIAWARITGGTLVRAMRIAGRQVSVFRAGAIRLTTALSSLARGIGVVAGVLAAFDIIRLILRLRDTRSEAEKLNEELLKTGNIAEDAAENISKIPEALENAAQQATTSGTQLTAQLAEVNRRLGEVGTDPQAERDRLRDSINRRVALESSRDISMGGGNIFDTALQDDAQRFEYINALLAEQARLRAQIRMEAEAAAAAAIAQSFAERESTRQAAADALEAGRARGDRLRQETVDAGARETRIALRRAGPRPVDFGRREPGVSRPGDTEFNRAVTGIQTNTGNIYDALRLLDRALNDIVRLPVSRGDREADVRRRLGDDAADVRFPQQVIVPSITDAATELDALSQTFQTGNGNIIQAFQHFRTLFTQSGTRLAASLTSETLPEIFRFSRGLMGLGEVLDDATTAARRNAESQRQQQQATQQARAGRIGQISTQFLNDLVNTPARINDINSRLQRGLQDINIDLQRDIERINRDAELSAQQRADKIEEVERNAAQRRIDLERQVNREKGQAYTAFTRNALANTAELIRAEIQAAIIRSTTARITSSISSALGPTLLGLGTGGSVGLGLAAILALQFGASFLNNRVFHFADTDRIAALAGRESATRTASDTILRENAQDFSNHFGRTFADTFGEALSQRGGAGGQPLVLNAVDIDSDEGIANRYVRVQELIDAGVIVRGA